MILKQVDPPNLKQLIQSKEKDRSQQRRNCKVRGTKVQGKEISEITADKSLKKKKNTQANKETINSFGAKGKGESICRVAVILPEITSIK